MMYRVFFVCLTSDDSLAYRSWESGLPYVASPSLCPRLSHVAAPSPATHSPPRITKPPPGKRMTKLYTLSLLLVTPPQGRPLSQPSQRHHLARHRGAAWRPVRSLGCCPGCPGRAESCCLSRPWTPVWKTPAPVWPGPVEIPTPRRTRPTLYGPEADVPARGTRSQREGMGFDSGRVERAEGYKGIRTMNRRTRGKLKNCTTVVD